ncbi:alpha/beta hydrolase [Novacetimonas hansenii]|uniref:alpha/beta hydrolase n=1 Tax=Novacetimonas hansenii TaxID=436 RepID=UPI0039EB8669
MTNEATMWSTFPLKRLTVLLAPAFLLTPAFARDHHRQDIPAISEQNQAERSVDLSLNDGSRLRVLISAPSTPRGTLIMLPGGAGDIGLEKDGNLEHGHNFVVRTHGLWNRQGYTVLIPDTINRTNLRGARSSPAYARLVEDLITYAHQQETGPVFLLGTSQGSIAAVNGAAHARPGSIAGVVLTESVSVMGGSGETVFSADPQQVRVPVLVVANRDDACTVAPPQNAQRIAASMTASKDVHVLMISGGITRSRKDCGSLTPHGYFGIEDQVVAKISAWLNAHS